MRRLIPALLLAVAACSPGEEVADSTTSIPQATTTTAAATTSVPVEATTVQTTTTTTASTTTTTLPPTTTTTVAQGNWARQPLVTTPFGALGWWDGSAWVDAATAGTLPVSGGENYQIAVIGLEATTTGGPQTEVCEPLFNIGVELDNDHLFGEFPGPYGVGLSAPWELQPHLFEAVEDDGTYAGIASDLLAGRGLDVENPVIKQLFRTDLEGDGVNEVLVVAEDLSGGLLPQVGDYSIIFMRKVVLGEVETAVFGSSVITDPEGAFSVSYTYGAVGDLNGDGQMELVIDEAYFEGLGVGVWEYVDDDLGPVQVLSSGCGA